MNVKAQQGQLARLHRLRDIEDSRRGRLLHAACNSFPPFYITWSNKQKKRNRRFWRLHNKSVALHKRMSRRKD